MTNPDWSDLYAPGHEVQDYARRLAHSTGLLDHVRFDAPLESDITAVARTVSGWVHTSGDVRDVAADALALTRAPQEDVEGGAAERRP
mgnify:CR=1 FL=1